MTESRNGGTDYRARRRPGGRYTPKRKVCSFCVNHAKTIDYKDWAKLQSYISDRGKIYPRRRSGVCARHQGVLCMAIKRARFMALLPCVAEHVYKTAGRS